MIITVSDLAIGICCSSKLERNLNIVSEIATSGVFVKRYRRDGRRQRER